MEINSENKAKFFAQYYGQRVLWHNEGDKKLMPLSNWCTVPNYGEFDKWMCLLKPLSSISDEDAILLAKYESTFFKETDIKIEVIRETTRVFIAATYGYLCGVKIEIGNPFKLNISGIDFLRSKGYALPWMGLTVDRMVEAGWIKLQER